MPAETQNIQDQDASATVNPPTENEQPPADTATSDALPTSESVVAAETAVDTSIVDDSGYRVGQSWEHDGFSIDGTLFGDTLKYVAVENEESQKAHVRQFRYRQTFATLADATKAIDSAQDKHEMRDTADAEAGRPAAKRSTGYTDAQMSANGWQRITPN